MLVLTRKQKETIKIGDNITITILRMKGQTVRVGIEAPRDVRVVRGELNALADDAAAVADSSSDIEQEDEVPQVVQFRFKPSAHDVVAKSAARGPLSSFVSSLHLPGAVSETV